MELKSQLKALKHGVKINYPMSRLTSFKVGGPCDYLVKPADWDEIKKVITACKQFRVFYKVLGKGTNLLVKDGGIRGVVILIGTPFAYWKLEEASRVKAGAAILLPQLAKVAMEQGLSGLEFAAGIPGSLGGALNMNAGAYGRSLGQLVEKVVYLNQDGSVLELTSEEAGFAYRYSNFLNKKGVILEAQLKLKPEKPKIIRTKMEEIINKRQIRQPFMPSAGSVFRNPPHCPAGQLIEEAGCKGLQVGGAQVSEKHGNFIVNTGNARASDILSLVSLVKQKVKDHTRIELHLEIEVVGED